MSALETYYLLSLLLLSVCLFAMWKGGKAERVGSIIVLGMVIAERMLHIVLPPSWGPILSLCGDGLTALGLLAVALRFASLWLGGVMLFYAAQFALHSFYLVTGRSNREALHIVLNDINFGGILVCLAVGTCLTWAHRVRQAPGSGSFADPNAPQPAAP